MSLAPALVRLRIAVRDELAQEGSGKLAEAVDATPMDVTQVDAVRSVPREEIAC